MRRLVPILAAVLQIPALLVVESAAAVRLVELTGLGGVIPSGVHTYMPLAEAIPFTTLVAWAVPSSVLGLGLLSLHPRWRSAEGRRKLLSPSPANVARALAMVVAAQLAGYLLQIAYVSHVQGIADTGAVLIVAAACQLGLMAFVAGLVGVIAIAPRAMRSRAMTVDWDLNHLVVSSRTGLVLVRMMEPVACAPRRGPPAGLLIPSHS